MQRIGSWSLLGIFLLLGALCVSAYAGPGKIKGKVTDRETGQPIIGANILVETTVLGAASDVNGEFTVLSVPPGTYSVRVSFIGFRPVVRSNVRVSADLTTDANFALESEAVSIGTIEIVAQAPLVNKSATNFVQSVSADQIAQLPVREVRAVFALTPGVIVQGGNYYVRGGRLEETAFYVDGVLSNNPINGQLALNVINNALEEVQTQIGGMTAQYGNAMSGLVNASTKTGGPAYHVSAEAVTDQLGGVHSKNIFGAYSYGQSEYVATVGGPVVPSDNRFRFFVAGQRRFNRSAATYIDGYKLPVTIDSNAIVGADWVVVNRHDPVAPYATSQIPTGHRSYIANLLNNMTLDGGRNTGGFDNDAYAVEGNILADLGPVNIKIGGSYDRSTNLGSNGRGLGVLDNLAGLYRPVKTLTVDLSAYAKLTHFVNPSTYYTAQVNYFSFHQTVGDNILWDNIEAYGNPDIVPTLVGPSTNPPAWSIYSFNVAWPGSISRDFTKAARDNLSGRLDFTHEFGQRWDFKVGGEFNRYTIRSYTIQARSLYETRLYHPTASDWFDYNNAQLNTYGYDIYGNTFAGGSFTDHTGQTVDLSGAGPRHPVFFGAYVQNKLEFADLIINAGLRYDFFDPGAPQYKDPTNIGSASQNGILVIADSSYLATRTTYHQLSPRLGFSFPVADRSVFHASFGKFMQMGRLSDLYTSPMTAAYFFNGVYAYQQPNPNLRPERTTDYETGFRQQLGEQSSFDLTFFYKDIRDLHVVRSIFPTNGSAYYTTVNGDFGTSKGFTLDFQMRRTDRLALTANYTLSSSISTGSNSTTHFDIAWQDNSYGGKPYYPTIPAPTAFDRTHSGNVNLDYRFEKDDGPTVFGAKILERTGLNVLFAFSSGLRYTLSEINGNFNFSSVNAPQAYDLLNGSTGPWMYEVDLKLDKTFAATGHLDVNVYLWITNLFNTKNVVNGIYSGTGSPSNDGYLTTSGGIAWAQRNGPSATALYQFLDERLDWYGPPRQVRIGARLDM